MALRWGQWDARLFPVPYLPKVLLITFAVQLLSFWAAGLYRGIWRFSSTQDLLRIFKGASGGVVLSLCGLFLLDRLTNIPRSLFAIYWFILVVGLGGGRFIYRLWRDRQQTRTQAGPRINVLIAGAGSAGERLLRDIQLNPQLGLQVVGFVDDDSRKLNMSIHGVKILGTTADLPRLTDKLSAQQLFIAIPSAIGADLDRILRICDKAPLEIKTLPRVDDILMGKIEVSLLRNLSLDDLLGRAPVELDSDDISEMVQGRSVLVTGAGGSIGSELCRQLARFTPSRLVLFESCEFFLYEKEMELREAFPGLDIVPVIGDVRDRNRVEHAFSNHRPDLVFHAAAYKHVPMMERNPSEAVRTNVLGTRNVVETAEKFGARKFVLISTDKAVNPTNIMGATKRIAEMICENMVTHGARTQFITVRFGNVIGSNGSVVPLFKRQIERGGPVTVTHPEITRYFMSISEASKLVLQAASMGIGGEVFVLDMGRPIKIVDLVDRLIQLAGLVKDKDIKVEFTGLRAGEKLHEEMFQSGEEFARTGHAKVFRAKNRAVDLLFEKRVDDLIRSTQEDWQVGLDSIGSIVPEYTPHN